MAADSGDAQGAYVAKNDNKTDNTNNANDTNTNDTGVCELNTHRTCGHCRTQSTSNNY